MDTKLKYELAQRALKSLEGILVELKADPSNEIYRDASIQRFEYTVEAFWKFLKDLLEERHGLIAKSPRQVLRSMAQVGEMEEGMAEVFLRMIDDRNLTTHTYIAELASAISQRIPEYAKRMHEALSSVYQ